MTLLFKERQRFTQWWIWLVLITTACLTGYVFMEQIILGNPVGSKPLPDAWVIFFSFMYVLILFFFWLLELRTEIDSEEVRARLYPFIEHKFFWDEVKNAEVIQYKFVGYGLRFSIRYGTVLNIAGNKGLAIELHSGARFLIGTQDPDSLKALVDAKKKNSA
ncbi:MAG: hypothetical protein OER83_04190 [Flavobacteriaceae bacterium]|nr:hypothetical protein [Flavobacteriaceae bacterium]MDH3796055.1 hypothetical protein [Flavobacteriaceae bacterium]